MNVGNDSYYVYINQVSISFNIPALLINSQGNIEHDLQTEMVDALMKLERCDEYNGGHWDSIIFVYKSIGAMRKYVNIDENKVRILVNKYYQKAKRR